MTTIKERLVGLEVKVKILLILVAGQMGLEAVPLVSAMFIK